MQSPSNQKNTTLDVPGPSNFAESNHGDLQSLDALPPEYTELDEAPRSFTIAGSFVYTPAGPRYQLSSNLDHASVSLKIRRLRAKEVHKVSSSSSEPLAFDKDGTLYTIDDAAFQQAHVIRGLRKQCLRGTLTFESGLTRVKIMHQPNKDGPKFILFDVKKNKRGLLEWKSAEGAIIGTEFMREDACGIERITLELTDSLSLSIREALLTCWVARHWQFAQDSKPKEPVHKKFKRRLLVGNNIAYGRVFEGS